MIRLPGYQTQQIIHSGPRSTIYKALRNNDLQPVLIKTASQPQNRHACLRLYQEYVIARSLVHPNINTYLDQIETSQGPALIMENFGARSLNLPHGRQGLTQQNILGIAIQLLAAIREIHNQGLVHGDLWPGNVVFAGETVKLIDLGMASYLEYGPVVRGLSLEALAFKAPEQVSRMYRKIDFRTDFYSLGATCYSLLVGRPPFTNQDQQEMIYHQINKSPAPMQQIREDLGPGLVAVIERLMARRPDDRYQSAEGILADFQLLQEDASSGGFETGLQDKFNLFIPSGRLIGREKELEGLQEAFIRVDRGECEVVLIKGRSGSGKTTLVRELATMITGRRGYLASGRFEQGCMRAYSALAQAFGDLLKQIAGMDDKTTAAWNQSLETLLGPGGQVLSQMIPELDLFLEHKGKVPDLDAREVRHRFNLAFRNFITLFASEEHSLILFLDDMQYADTASLQLLEFLFSQSDFGHFLLVGAINEEELTPDKPLSLFLHRIEGEPITLHQVSLKQLNQKNSALLLAEDLRCDPEDVIAQATKIFEHTAGNPLYYRELIRKLARDGALSWSTGKKGWILDAALLDETLVHGDLTALMIARWHEVPAQTRDLLQMALCIGSRFEPQTLVLVNEITEEECARNLWPALCNGLLIPTSTHFPTAPPTAPIRDFQMDASYQFFHNAFRNRVLSLLPERRKIRNHLRLGQHLLLASKQSGDESRIFEIVGHLNLGRSLITDKGELEELIRLNNRAARRANEANAPRQALGYLETAIALFDEGTWERNFDLAFEVYRRFVLSCYLCSEFEQAEKTSNMVLAKARTALQKVELLQIQAEQGIMSGNDQASVQSCLEGLTLLGMKCSAAPSLVTVAREHFKVRRELKGIKPDDLLNRAEITDPSILAMMRLLTRLVTPAFALGNVRLFAFSLLRRMSLTLNHGNCPEAANALIGYALLRCAQGKLTEAEKLAEVGLSLGEHYEEVRFRCRLYFTFCQVIAWTRHPDQVRIYLKKAIEAGFQSGDLVYMAYALADLCIRVKEKTLEQVIRTIRKNIIHVKRLKHRQIELMCQISLQFYKCLRGETNNRMSLDDDRFNESECLQAVVQADARLAQVTYHLVRLKLCICYAAYEEGLAILARASYIEKSSAGRLEALEIRLYGSLAYSGAYSGLNRDRRGKALKFMNKTLRQVKRFATHCPANFAHLELLLEGERARIKGNYFAAARNYACSMELARRHRHPFFEALAGELAARFHQERGESELAADYLNLTYDFFSEWGARAKKQYLEETYGETLLKDRIISRPKDPTNSGTWTDETIQDGWPTTTSSTTRSSLEAILLGSSAQDLDLATVAKSSRAISSETDMPLLIDKMMRIILENVGGQRGFLLLEREGRLHIRAAVDIDSKEGIVVQDRTLEEESRLPAAVVRYVRRTAEPVVLRDAAREGSFTDDPYIARFRPRSILCTAIRKEDKVNGVLYLENNLTAGAFTRGRVQVLQVLLAQAAISLENARLFEGARLSADQSRRLNQELESRVEERTAQLESTQRQLIERAHQAGMADLASTVLHNVGNILSTVNTSCHLIRSTVENSRLPGIARANELLQRHSQDPVSFLSQNPQGRDLLQYYIRLGHFAAREHEVIEENAERLLDKIHAIKDAIMAQQSYAAIGFQSEEVHLDKVIDHALNMQDLTLTRRDILIERDYQQVPKVSIQRVKLIHIVVNLIKNALEAMDQSTEKKIRIRVASDENFVYARISDSGMGVAPEHMDKIFNYGFTTKQGGHGFGLHGSANAMTEMNGSLMVESTGVGRGATFVLKFPIAESETKASRSSNEVG